MNTNAKQIHPASATAEDFFAAAAAEQVKPSSAATER